MPNNFETEAGGGRDTNAGDAWNALVGFGSKPDEFIIEEKPQAQNSDKDGEKYELPGFGLKPEDSYVGEKPAQAPSSAAREVTHQEFGLDSRERTFREDGMKRAEYIEDVEFGSDNPQRHSRLEPVLPEKPKTSLSNKEADIPFGTDENNGETSL